MAIVCQLQQFSVECLLLPLEELLCCLFRISLTPAKPHQLQLPCLIIRISPLHQLMVVMRISVAAGRHQAPTFVTFQRGLHTLVVVSSWKSSLHCEDSQRRRQNWQQQQHLLLFVRTTLPVRVDLDERRHPYYKFY